MNFFQMTCKFSSLSHYSRTGVSLPDENKVSDSARFLREFVFLLNLTTLLLKEKMINFLRYSMKNFHDFRVRKYKGISWFNGFSLTRHTQVSIRLIFYHCAPLRDALSTYTL